MDVPGYFVSAVFFKVYPEIVGTYGWPTLWRVVSAMVAMSTVCITVQQKLEAAGAKAIINNSLPGCNASAGGGVFGKVWKVLGMVFLAMAFLTMVFLAINHKP